MRTTTIIGATVLAMGLPGAWAQSPQRAAAAIDCAPTGAKLTYACEAAITDQASKAPIEGLDVEVKADMPSMPMAHNIPPVAAAAGDKPGIYGFTITLDMPGAWAFTLRLSGAREDMLVEVIDFTGDGEGHGNSNAGHGSGG